MTKRSQPPSTPIVELLRLMTPEQRDEFAALAGTTVGYLYQLGGVHRSKPSAALALGIEDASREMLRKYGKPLFEITVREIVEMCSLSGLEGEGR